MVKIIGTTHLMSKEEIYKILDNENPDIICVELDKFRFDLMSQPVVQEGFLEEDNSLLGKISKTVKKKAEEENLQYGSDMINAANYANEKTKDLEFIDRELIETKRLMDLLPKNELMFFISQIQQLEQEKLQREVNEEEVLKNLRREVPVAFEFLITSRDLFMAYNLLRIKVLNPGKKIVAVVGKGHLKKLNAMVNIEQQLKGGNKK